MHKCHISSPVIQLQRPWPLPVDPDHPDLWAHYIAHTGTVSCLKSLLTGFPTVLGMDLREKPCTWQDLGGELCTRGFGGETCIPPSSAPYVTCTPGPCTLCNTCPWVPHTVQYPLLNLSPCAICTPVPCTLCNMRSCVLHPVQYVLLCPAPCAICIFCVLHPVQYALLCPSPCAICTAPCTTFTFICPI